MKAQQNEEDLEFLKSYVCPVCKDLTAKKYVRLPNGLIVCKFCYEHAPDIYLLAGDIRSKKTK